MQVVEAENSTLERGFTIQKSPQDTVRFPKYPSLTDAAIIDQITRRKREAKERLRYIMDTALRCYDQYRNKMDFSDKEDWQSRITIAKAHAAVKQATANIMKLLTQTEQPITVEEIIGSNPFKMLWGFTASDVEAGILKHWEVAHFRETLRDLLEGGFACGIGVVKVGMQMSQRNFTTIGDYEGQPAIVSRTMLQKQISLHSIDPWRFWFGPNTQQFGKVDFCGEEYAVDLPTLKGMGGWENLDWIDKEDVSEKEEDSKQQRRKDLYEKSEHVARQTRILEYTGDIIDEESQTVVAADQKIFIANDRVIIKFGDIPFWDKKKGYVVYSPLSVAFRFPGQGIVEATASIKEAVDEIAQMQVDHLKFSLLNMYEVDMGAMENPADLSTGVEPGKFFRKRQGTAAVQAIRPIEQMPLTGDSFNALLAYGNEYQRGTFITDIVQGMLDTKGETTATEVQTTQANTTLMLSDIALHIEDTLLAPIAELTWDRLFQFCDANSNPNWQTVLGPRGAFLDALPPEQRFAIITGDYNFSARGLSRTIERTLSRQQLLVYVQTLGQYGPLFMPFLNMPEIFRRIHESFHFPNADALLSPMAQQVMMQMTQNLVMQANPMAAIAGQTAQQVATTEAKTSGNIETENVKAQNQLGMELVKAALQPQGGGNGEV